MTVANTARQAVRIPRAVLLPLAGALTVAAYYLILFTDHGTSARAGGALRTAAFHAVVVLATFGCWEVFRTERPTPVRAMAGAVGAPLALFVVATLLYGLRRHVAP